MPHLIGSGDFFKDELVGLGESSGEGKYNFVLEVNQKVTILCGPSLNCQENVEQLHGRIAEKIFVFII